MKDTKKKSWFTTSRQRILIIVAIPLAVTAIVVNVIMFIFRN
jgi:hypothetical protein